MNRLRSIFLFLIASVLSLNLSFGQDLNEHEELVTDRPDLTESSRAVPVKTLQVETGVSYTSDIKSGIEESVFGYGETLIRYGLLQGMELRLAFDYSVISTAYPYNNILLTERGISPLAFGTKVNLSRQQGWIPEMALLVHIHVPLFKSDFQTDYAIPEIILAASHRVSANISIGYNIGIDWSGNNAFPGKFYSLVGGFGLSERVGIYIESSGRFGENEFQNIIDGGITFLILPRVQYDLSAGIGVTSSSPDFFIGTGISFRLPQ